jgi:hypothetical protein
VTEEAREQIARIKDAVCRVHFVDPAVFEGRYRKREHVTARMHAMYLMRQILNMNPAAIAEEVGTGRCSVIHHMGNMPMFLKKYRSHASLMERAVFELDAPVDTSWFAKSTDREVFRNIPLPLPKESKKDKMLAMDVGDMIFFSFDDAEPAYKTRSVKNVAKAAMEAEPDRVYAVERTMHPMTKKLGVGVWRMS